MLISVALILKLGSSLEELQDERIRSSAHIVPLTGWSACRDLQALRAPVSRVVEEGKGVMEMSERC